MRISLPVQMGIGLILGAAAGVVGPDYGFDASFFRPIGDLFIRLIRMVVVPLVLFTLIAGSATCGNVRKIGRIALKTIVYYALSTAVAISIGLIIASLLHPGAGEGLMASDVKSGGVGAPNLVGTLLNIVPMNPISAMSQGAMLQIIFFAVLFGLSISAVGPRACPLHDFFEMCGNVMIKLTGFVMLYAPIGVFGLMAFAVSLHGVTVLLPLAQLIGVMYLAALIHVLIVYVPLILFAGVPVSRFLRASAEPLMVAFTTCSSAAALPSSLRTVRELGATKGVASFSIPLGNTVNMHGTAIYMGIAAIFVAEFYGIPLDFGQKLLIMVLGMFVSVSTLGLPGGALLMISMIFTEIGIPLEGIVLIAGIDRVMDMARTTLNVFGDLVGAILVTKLEGELNAEPFREEDAEVV